jgi:Glycosyltransferase family 87
MRSKLLAAYFLILTAALITIWLTASKITPLFYTSSVDSTVPGTEDFIEYWSAYKAISNGLNPYDPAIMLAIQQPVNGATAPMMMWNPPWALTLIAPVLQFNFLTSARLWALISLMLCILVISLSLQSVRTNNEYTKWQSYFPPFLLGALWAPVLATLIHGQLSLFLAMGLLFWNIGQLKDRKILIIFGMIIFSFKPHLFHTLAIFTLWKLIVRRDIRLLAGLIFTFAVLLLVTYGMFPTAISHYFDSITHPQYSNLVPNLYQWVGPTLGGLIRIGDVSVLGIRSQNLAIILPLCTDIAALIFFKMKQTTKLDPVSICMLSMLSVFTSPFGWFFDYAALLPIHVLLVFRATCDIQDGRYLPAFALSVHHIISVLLMYSGILFYQHHYWWFLPSYVIIPFVVFCPSSRLQA